MRTEADIRKFREKGKKKFFQEKGFYPYDSTEVRAKGTVYTVSWSGRSDGKTFDALTNCLEDYWLRGKTSALIRRWEEDFKGDRGRKLCEGITEAGWIDFMTEGEYDHAVIKLRKMHLAKWTVDEKSGKRIEIVDPTSFCDLYWLTGSEHDKGGTLARLGDIYFDEFIGRSYLPDEFVLLMNTLSTIIRNRPGVKVHLLGNTINPYNPYFAEMGLFNAKKQEKGTIDIYTFGEDGVLTLAAERIFTDRTSVKARKGNAYFAFDNPKLKMITDGDWEIPCYPRVPIKYVPKDVKFKFFIRYDNEMVQCDCVSIGRNAFVACHPKTTEIKFPDKDLIYCPTPDPRPNWRTRITRPVFDIEKRVLQLLQMDKWFYATNETGELVRNYLEWCAG